MAIEHLERVLDLSAGVGTVLLEVADWASAADTHASLERFAVRDRRQPVMSRGHRR